MAARRSRSIAVCQDGSVYEWGFVGSDNDQFHKLPFTLPGKCKDVQIGIEFNLFLLEDGSLYMFGQITQEGMNVLHVTDSLLCLSEKMPKQVNFKSVQCGYSHAILLDEDDKVYTFGAGLFGQLGIGVEEGEIPRAKYPIPLDDVNDEFDRILNIACGAHFSICYSELGILYYWGMLIPDDVNSIQWSPNFMGVSLPKDLTEIELLSFRIVDIKATYREVLACDAQGRIYHCDLTYN